jgi:isopentenyl diphosphate isomerase/L-lactate dehydrogenase-like FMN-dependent dehydrogenase
MEMMMNTDIRDKARDLMKGFCRVCPECNGRACKNEVPGMGGIGSASSFISNVETLASIKFNMSVLHDCTDPETGTTLLGRKFSLPLLAAPIGGVSFNMGGQRSEEEYINAVLAGCVNSGILGCTGDGVPPVIHESAFFALKELKGEGIPFIKPWEDGELFEKLDKAVATGVKTVGIDVDAAGLITLKMMGRPVSPKPLPKLKEIIEKYPVDFILKGVMTVKDAKVAIDAGASAIVVSNHGGRVLDHTPGVAQVLPQIAKAVSKQITILSDGGVRTGGDIVKMLALGADGVMIGRPFSVSAIGGLREGVTNYIKTLTSQMKETMLLTGCKDIESINSSILF